MQNDETDQTKLNDDHPIDTAEKNAPKFLSTQHCISLVDFQ